MGEGEPAVWAPRKQYPEVTASYRNYMRDEVLRDLQISVTRIADKKYHKAYVVLRSVLGERTADEGASVTRARRRQALHSIRERNNDGNSAKRARWEQVLHVHRLLNDMTKRQEQGLHGARCWLTSCILKVSQQHPDDAVRVSQWL